jgi:hypothetical protein
MHVHSKEGSEDASYGGVKSVEENRYFESLQEKCGSEHLGEHMLYRWFKKHREEAKFFGDKNSIYI